MDADTADAKLLDAAEALFNEHGVQAVGMDAIRSGSGVSLKRLYQLYPAKDRLVEAVLNRRDLAVRAELAAFLEPYDDPHERVLAVFDYLDAWFRREDFRGCTFINTFGELGGVNDAVAQIARTHKAAFLACLRELVEDAGEPAALADQLAILANGAMATAAITQSPDPAGQARAAAAVLLAAAR
ncbi:TetR/AcrR family transcriptional regulator [Rhodococcus spelaei]|uniref:TetR/AcrR family transcriptional regulator n=1 Tax=Rhodococcus spelaei TaxID=2546320 RepID=A0A541BPQ0_9NOCA|nr:TetR/AcrR family transcriptional regulator [Rhodococcus spelaei]TQF74228.1 TetR/AcrR family transcriptional regulator [Rhodococcus spelaei]